MVNAALISTCSVQYRRSFCGRTYYLPPRMNLASFLAALRAPMGDHVNL